MAKGSGLSFDPDPIKPIPTVLNSFLEPHNNHFYPRNNIFFNSSSMESSYNNRSPPPTIQFPVNLNCSTTHHDQDEQHIRPVIDEMDFFADKKNATNSEEPTTANDSDRKESNTPPPPPPELDFNINTALHLLTANTYSDQSLVDDGLSPNSDDKRIKSEVRLI
ncbi:hypothetical protein MTR67_032362 [Solanum verrucosum]|uniref:Uncharacterized protein n=1 Tax=Solanum verrucosum TaxID=315347 RepID=A0AAF0U440_SOLVR|nr:hypothetical protein MTR67_032362 [Solanum verrucosum]